MSILRDFRKKEIETLPGLDDTSPPARSVGAQLVRNCRFELDFVQSRAGFEAFKQFTTTDPSPGGHEIQGFRRLMHWLSASWSRLMMFSKASADGSVEAFVTHYNFNIGTREDVVRSLGTLTTTCLFAEYGSRVFMAFLDDDGDGAASGRVWNGLFNSALGVPGPVVDTLFQAPLQETSDFTAATSEPSAGVVTAGDHKLGLVFQTRNGHETKAIELDATFTATGDMSLRLTLTPVSTWPLWVDGIKPLFSTVQNNELLYFVPDTSVAPLIGTSTPALIDINISDIELAAGATEATDWFALATSNEVGNIKFVGVYGSRMVYISDISDAGTLSQVSHIWFSEQDDPQRLFADRSIRHLPGKRNAITGFQIYGTYYVVGTNWTYAFNDTTDEPVTWFAPEQISDTIGVTSPHCVTVNKPRNVAWVASKTGLYAFDGQFPVLPTSYYQSETWKRINWEAPVGSFDLKDYSDQEIVVFLAPLDGAGRPTHLLVWDYKKGIQRDRVRFSLDDIRKTGGPFGVGAIEVVQHPTTKKLELWVGPENGDTVYRQKNPQDDSSPYNDLGVGYVSRYRSGALTPVHTAPLNLGAVHARVEGQGEAEIDAFGYDQKRRRGSVTRELSGAVHNLKLALFGFRSETAYFDISNGGRANHRWKLSRLVAHYKEWLQQR